jgi:hypothetical protein
MSGQIGRNAMKKAVLIVAALLLFGAASLAQDTIPEPTQSTDVPYRMFRSQNIHTLLKLDTRTGQVWQVQWGDEEHRFVSPINTRSLVDGGKSGRFTLCPTLNIYTFILLDQEDGRTWQVQWGSNSVITPIK